MFGTWHEPRLNEGTALLRVGIALVYLYFGVHQLLAPSDWTGWLPAWTSGLPVTPELLIVGNGLFEVTLGLLLLAGFGTRLAALLLALHLAVITLEVGWSEIGARDFGLTLATAALALLPADRFTLDAWRARKRAV